MKTKRLLLDYLLEMAALSGEEKTAYAEGLYLTNTTFAKYMDLCYALQYESMFEAVELPTFSCENLPYGMHDSQLERAYNKFSAVAYTRLVPGVEGLKLSDNRRLMLLTQIMEGLSDIEQVFLTAILSGSYSALPRKNWHSLKHGFVA